MERSIAVCHGKQSFYDEKPSLSYELQTAGLTTQEAQWLEQMLTAHEVRLITRPDLISTPDKLPEVLITEFNSEIHDSDEDVNRIKLTWKFAHEGIRLDTSQLISDYNIHNEPYSHQHN